MIIDCWKVTRNGDAIRAARHQRVCYLQKDGETLKRVDKNGARLSVAKSNTHLTDQTIAKIAQAIEAAKL